MTGEDPIVPRLLEELVLILGTVIVTGFMTSLTTRAIAATPFIELLHIGIGLGAFIGLLGVFLLFQTPYADWNGPRITDPRVYKSAVGLSLLIILLAVFYLLLTSITDIRTFSRNVVILTISLFAVYLVLLGINEVRHGNSILVLLFALWISWSLLRIILPDDRWSSSFPAINWEFQYLGVLSLLYRFLIDIAAIAVSAILLAISIRQSILIYRIIDDILSSDFQSTDEEQ